jgi:Phosphoglycerol transferase and related proteins, alkaline phosphatase superfamily
MKFLGNTTGLRYYLGLVWRLALLLLLYTLSRYVFYRFNSDLFGQIPSQDLALIFKGGLRFDIAAVLYVNFLYILLMLLPISAIYRPRPQRWLKGLFVVSNFVAFAANTADFYYFRFTLRRTDSSFFSEFSGGEHLGKIIWEAMGQQWPLVLFLLGLLLALWLCYGRISRKIKIFPSSRFYLSRSVAFLVAIPLIIVGVRGGVDRTTRPIAMSNAGAYIQEPVQAGIVLNTPFCLIRSSSQKGLPRQAFFSSDAALEAIYSPLHAAPSDSLKGYNVVVFILESFARPQIGAMNTHIEGHVGYTPFLDSLISQGHACVNAYANGRKSIDALPSVLGSIPSLTEPFALTPYSLNQMEGLGTLLGRKGYHTSFFHGAPNGSMGFDAMANMLGFSHYYGKTEYGNDADYDGVWGIWDEPFLQFYARKLTEFSQPFASAVFTLSSHHPYKVPSAYKDLLPKGPEPLNQCIAYTDLALRRFFEKASQQPWFANTLFVFTADHSIWSETWPEYQNSLDGMAIPIVYYFPGKIAPAVDEQPTQQIDIMPTILTYLGYDAPFFAYGRALQDKSRTPFVMNYTGNYQLLRGESLLLFDGQQAVPSSESPTPPPPPSEEDLDFIKAFIQQYNNRLIDGKLRF